MLTRRGWSLLGAATGLYIGSRLLGLVQLVVLAVIGLLLLAGASIWVRLHPLDLVAERAPPRAAAGRRRRARRRRRSSRTAERRLPTVTVSDAFDRGRRSAALPARAARAATSTARAAYRLPTDQRGRFELGPLPRVGRRPVRAREPDTTRARHRRGDRVPPRARDHVRSPRPAATISTATCRARTAGSTRGGEFLNLRDYEPGDDLRRVHWRSTARAATIDGAPERGTAPHAGARHARRAARAGTTARRSSARSKRRASVVTACELAQRPYELVLSTGVVIGAAGRRHLASVMDELAVVEPHGPDRIVASRDPAAQPPRSSR